MNNTEARRVLSADAVTHFEFLLVPLRFESGTHVDVFAQKNTKTLSQTLVQKKYVRLTSSILPKYASCLAMPLGSFLNGLKRKGDSYYRQFLNPYGDLAYSTFALADGVYLNAKGVYAYYIGTDLKYIGRCRDSMKKRVNNGYGNIHPKNCYIDGQATNCRLNALITPAREEASLWLCSIQSDERIETVERLLLRRYNPPWNIQKP